MTDATHLDLEQVLYRTHLTRQLLFSLLEEGTFPSPISHLQPPLAWRETDIEAWIDARPRAVVHHPQDLEDTH